MAGNCKWLVYPWILVLLIGISACGGGGAAGTAGSSGGGGSDPGVSYAPKIMSWAPPNAYTDSTPLNPVTDLDRFEIYVKEAGQFAESDIPLATVSAIDPSSGQVSSTFNLANLGPFLSPGVQYQVSIRAVAISGEKSAFSSTASFSL